jgi:hypothetical protein
MNTWSPIDGITFYLGGENLRAGAAADRLQYHSMSLAQSQPLAKLNVR